jgi:hypothetical protein
VLTIIRYTLIFCLFFYGCSYEKNQVLETSEHRIDLFVENELIQSDSLTFIEISIISNAKNFSEAKLFNAEIELNLESNFSLHNQIMSYKLFIDSTSFHSSAYEYAFFPHFPDRLILYSWRKNSCEGIELNGEQILFKCLVPISKIDSNAEFSIAESPLIEYADCYRNVQLIENIIW